MDKKDKQQKAPQSDAALNPYMEARREWLERYGDYIAQAKNWRIAAFGAILVALAAVVGLAVSASQSKITPYVVEVDKIGNVAAVGPADKASTADQRVIKAYLSRFITDFRFVTSDLVQQKAALTRVYSMLPQGSAALTKVNESYKAASPFEAAASKTVQIEVTSVLPISEKTWQVEWTETTRNLQGGILGTPTRYQASVQVAINPPSDLRQVLINPLGIFLPDLNWTQVL